MLKKSALAIILMATAMSTASAQMLMTFDDPITLDPGQTAVPGEWYVDRFAPAAFESQIPFDGDNRLRVTLSPDDENPGNPFDENLLYQGRAYETPGAILAYADLYLDPDWGSGPLASFTAIGTNFADEATLLAILEVYKNDDDEFWLRTFDSDGSGSYTDLADLTDQMGDWVTLEAALDGALVQYSLDGTQLASQPNAGTSVFPRIALNAYNAQDQAGYEVYWDNVGYAVPEPATVAGLSFLVLLAGMVLRRRLRKG